MNDNQQIPSALKDYAEANGLAIDHNFLLTYSRYQTNLLLSFLGVGLFSITLFLQFEWFSIFFFSGFSVIGSLTVIPLLWSAFVGIRLLYIKKNWFPIQNNQTNLDMDYDKIMEVQGKNLKITFISYIFAALWTLVVYITSYVWGFDLQHLYPFSLIIYLLGMIIILTKSCKRYYETKTILHIPINQ